MITNLGIIILFIGILGNFFNQQKTRTFQVGEKFTYPIISKFNTGVKILSKKNAQ